MWGEDEKEQERRALLESSQSPVSLPPREPIFDPMVLAAGQDAAVDQAQLPQVEQAPVERVSAEAFLSQDAGGRDVPPPQDTSAAIDVKPEIPETDFAGLERKANANYETGLAKARGRADRANTVAGIADIGLGFNRVITGRDGQDPFIDFLRGKAGNLEARGEKDADRALRLELQNIRSLKQSKELDDPASDANRAYQAAMRQRWVDAGFNPADLPMLTGKQINESIKSGRMVQGQQDSQRALGLKQENLDLVKKDKEFKQDLDRARLAMTQAKNDQDRQKYGLENLRKYTDKVTKEFGEVPYALQQVQEVARKVGVPDDSMNQLASQLLNTFGKGADSRWDLNNPGERELYRAINSVANSLLKQRSGAAVSDPEARRLAQELATGELGTVRDTLDAFDKLRGRIGNMIRSYEEGYRQAIPQEIWDSAPNVLSTRMPIFQSQFAPEAGGQLPAVNVDIPSSTLAPKLDVEKKVIEPSRRVLDKVMQGGKQAVEGIKKVTGGGRSVVRKGRRKSDGKTVVEYSDGTREVLD